MPKHEILIVEDDDIQRKQLVRVLERPEYGVATACSGEEALRLLASRKFDLVISDLKMPGISGLELIERIKNAFPHTSLLIITAHASIASAIEAMKMIIADGSQHSVIMLDFFCTADIVGQELEKLGFVRAEQLQSDTPCLFRPIKNTKGISVAIDMPPHRTKRSLDFSKWYITKGDTDIDRIKL